MIDPIATLSAPMASRNPHPDDHGSVGQEGVDRRQSAAQHLDAALLFGRGQDHRFEADSNCSRTPKVCIS